MERGGGALFNSCVINAYTCAQMRDKSPVRSHRSLTQCPLHTREHDRKRHWADPKMHSPYPDGQPGHPY